MEIIPGALLKTIDSPADLRKLQRSQLPALCSELRQYIIDVVSTHGGHLAASLGVVELTVALHYVFNTPEDRLVWDVGHQAYGHKILTGRRESFITNRRSDGISGFPRRIESIYDTFGGGHSSTSISAALGMAEASARQGHFSRRHIAVIGDGAMTAGLAFEALNNAGTSHANLIIILNDNQMSIDPNLSALEKHLAGISPSVDAGGDGSGVVDEDGAVTGSQGRVVNIFTLLGLKYFGPVDGYDLDPLIDALEMIKDGSGPRLLHIKTIKGKGFLPAEHDQTDWHATGAFDKITGRTEDDVYDNPRPPKYQDVFGTTLFELAAKNDKIVAVTPAMPTGNGLREMMERMPGRVFDVGIGEQHAVTFSAGMACEGMKVFCAIYSTFMQRAYDGVIHDVALQNLPVIFCLDRSGLVGEDGPTHHGVFDMAFMRSIPDVIVSAPMDARELRNLMYTAQTDETRNAFVIRYPRGRATTTEWRTPFQKIRIGAGRKLTDGDEIAVLSIGKPGIFVEEAIRRMEHEGIHPAHYDMRFVKPLDEEILEEVCTTYKKIITVEDGVIKGGFGSAVLEWIAGTDYHPLVRSLGIPDRFIAQGTPDELYEEVGISTSEIIKAIQLLAEQ